MKQVIQHPVSFKKNSPNLTPFSETQVTTLNKLMDLFIPASKDGRMPAAQSLGLYTDITDLPGKDRLLMDRGLLELDERSNKLHGQVFAEINQNLAKAIVEKLRAEASPFIQTFMTQTAGRYLAHDTVVPLLGLELRPPWPKGNVVAQGDWSLIDVVSKRPKIYLDV